MLTCSWPSILIMEENLLICQPLVLSKSSPHRPSLWYVMLPFTSLWGSSTLHNTHTLCHDLLSLMTRLWSNIKLCGCGLFLLLIKYGQITHNHSMCGCGLFYYSPKIVHFQTMYLLLKTVFSFISVVNISYEKWIYFVHCDRLFITVITSSTIPLFPLTIKFR